MSRLCGLVITAVRAPSKPTVQAPIDARLAFARRLAALRVCGSDVDDEMLAHARSFVDTESLHNVSLVKDDLFASTLPPASFDIVHARFHIASLRRASEQLAVYRRLARPGGWIVLEDPAMASWRVNPDAPAVQKLIGWVEEELSRRDAWGTTFTLIQAAAAVPP